MKKINKNGFVMVETIIVAVFVIGICTFLFANFLPLIGDYERIEQYDTLEGKYKIHELRKMILREIENDNDLQSIFTDYLSSSTNHRYQNYTRNIGGIPVVQNELCDKVNSKSYCNKLLSKNFLDVKEVIVTKFKLGTFKSEVKSSDDFNRSLKEYVNYLPNYSKYSSKYDSYYRIILVFNNGEFANIEVHYEIG